MSKYPNIITTTECLRIDNFLKTIPSLVVSYLWIFEGEYNITIKLKDGEYLHKLGYCILFDRRNDDWLEGFRYSAKLSFKGVWVLYLLRLRDDHYQYHKASV